jgi:ComF family protein
LPPLTAITTPLDYAFPVDAAIKAMKFQRRLFYAPAFAHLLVGCFDTVPDDVDALLPMPLHWRRHAVRGFNQAAEINRPIGKATGLPIVSNVYRTRNTPYQSGLTANQRRRNLQAAFAARGDMSFKHVLIVDDVITTGETCRQLANVLIAAGAEKVSALAIARVLQD